MVFSYQAVSARRGCTFVDLESEWIRARSNADFFLFRRFYQERILIDYEESDVEGAETLLSLIAAAEDAKWPYVFGNELYKKFNLTYGGNRTEFLEAPEVMSLLADSPAGIFQVGTLISGPLGFLHSEQQRLTPPLLTMPLWHCSDVGCGALHGVEARQFNSAFTSFMRDSSRALADEMGPRSEWRKALDSVSKGESPLSGRLYGDMPAVICDCITGDEVQILCERALRSAAGSRVRQLVKGMASGPPEEVVRGLQSGACRNLLLLFKDLDLVAFMDELISTGKIAIPPTEVRRPRTYTSLGYNDHRTSLSSLGARATWQQAILRLQGEIWQAYSESNALGDLEWKIRRTKGQATGLRVALMEYIRQSGPEETVRNLIFPSQLVNEKIEKQLQFQLSASDTEEDSAKKLLWKFGFSIPRFGRDQELMRNRMAEFKAATLRMPPRPTEEDRAALRSIGVNLFISVEGFLEDLLAFNVWLISADHFVGTRFEYNKAKALLAVREQLGEFIGSGESKVYWNCDGANTLGTLLTYLAAFRNWLAGRRQTDRSILERDPQDLPHFADNPLWSFPFRHTALWADVPEDVLGAC
jgi:hypothetical protein